MQLSLAPVRSGVTPYMSALSDLTGSSAYAATGCAFRTCVFRGERLSCQSTTPFEKCAQKGTNCTNTSFEGRADLASGVPNLVPACGPMSQACRRTPVRGSAGGPVSSSLSLRSSGHARSLQACARELTFELAQSSNLSRSCRAFHVRRSPSHASDHGILQTSRADR